MHQWNFGCVGVDDGSDDSNQSADVKVDDGSNISDDVDKRADDSSNISDDTAGGADNDSTSTDEHNDNVSINDWMYNTVCQEYNFRFYSIFI